MFPLGSQKVREKASISPASIDFTAKLALSLVNQPGTAYLEKPQGRRPTSWKLTQEAEKTIFLKPYFSPRAKATPPEGILASEDRLFPVAPAR